MKAAIAALVLVATLGVTAAQADPMNMRHHHHRHQVCNWHHHHRVCHWR